jgi:hopene-associated glycosyltransferase HpnB
MLLLTAFALLIWLYLLFGHGRFWQAGPVLPRDRAAAAPSVVVVVPARDEAALIGQTLLSLLTQDYPGLFRVILVDDGSTDGTGEIARGLADPRLTIVTATARPVGWSGKLWAIAQGIDAAPDAAFLLLTDADVEHGPSHLSTLVAAAERDDLDLVSEMVALRCVSLAERALVPAFVFFFQLLYPFAWVNEPRRSTAAAAGGTMLLRRRALVRIGGIGAVRDKLIDDVALARKVKHGGRIWLGHATMAWSRRPYPSFAAIWQMIARTAYVQLRFSPLILVATILAMALIWLVPPIAAVLGHGSARWMGLAAWTVFAASYLPTLHRFGRSPLWAAILPLIAAFYTAATLGSAANHHLGRGVAWKGRAYQGTGA